MDVQAKTLTVLEFDKVRRQLAEHATFSGGRDLALKLLPSNDLATVKARLAATTEARDYLDRHGIPPLAGAHDVRAEVEAAARGRVLLPQELLDTRTSLQAADRARRALVRERGGWPHLAAIIEPTSAYPELAAAIGRAIDDEGRVVDDASPLLQRIRTEVRTVHDRLVRRLEAMMSRPDVRACLQEPLITQREGRFVLPVRSELRGKVRGIVHDTSDSGATVFVEPLALVELGNELRQLELDEQREVERILRELSARVGAEAAGLLATLDSLAQLDLVFAQARYGAALRAVTPLILEQGPPRARFPQARHPLLDPQTVVPVDLRIGEDFRQLVITGPNTGGKTVVLKTLGLCVLMAQSGLQVPAGDGAELAVFDAVFADIGDEQSIEQSLSTFSGHMRTIIAILQAATERSLVLLDELGAGTDPLEGEALAEAILDHLAARGIASVASSHYSRLKAYAHVTPGVSNASVEFDPVSLQPTFELSIGLPGRSNALAVAANLGLPPSIVEAARRRMTAEDLALDDLLAEIREARTAAAADRAAAMEARREAETWATRLEEAVASLKSERAAILAEAREQAEAELAEVRELVRRLRRRAESAWAVVRAAGADEMIGELGTIAAEVDAAAKTLEAASGQMDVAPARPDADALRPGQMVRLVRLAQVGEIIRVDRGEVEVQVGRMRMRVPLSDIAGLAPSPPLAKEVTVHRSAASAANVGVEVDLRGLRVADGLARLEEHLDAAVLQGLPWVRIIHGHGTGAMKAAVRDAVRHHPHVTRSRSGEAGEGGDGVTVAYLE